MQNVRTTLSMALLVSAAACDGGGTNTVVVEGETVYVDVPGPDVPGPEVEVIVEVEVPADIPNHQPPLVFLTEVYDDGGESPDEDAGFPSAIGLNGTLQSHMHIDEVKYRESDGKLFYCSYTWGVIDASEPADATYIAQGYDWDMFVSPVDRDTGCLHLDWSDDNEDIVFADHRGNYDFQPHLTAINLGTYIYDSDEDGIGVYDYDGDTSDDEPYLAPVLGDPLQEVGVSYEGLDYEDGFLFVALHAGGIGVYTYDPADLDGDLVAGEMVRVGGNTGLVTNAYDIHVDGTTAYVVDELEGLVILDVTNINAMTEIGRLFIGGINREVIYDDGYAYVAAGTPGFAIIDVSDPTSPTLESLTPAQSTVTRLGVHNDRVAVAGWTDTRVYDVTDKANPEMIGGVRIEHEKGYVGDDLGERSPITARILGMDIFEDTVFIGNWWVPNVYAIVDTRTAPYMVVPEDIYYMSTGTVAPGATGTYEIDIENDGNEDLHIFDTWTTNEGAFHVTPETAVIPPGDEQEFTITYTAGSEVDAYGVAVEETAIVSFASNDPNLTVRTGYVTGNPVGIGVGDPFPYSEAIDVNTLLTWTSDSFAGKVSVVAYFATF